MNTKKLVVLWLSIATLGLCQWLGPASLPAFQTPFVTRAEAVMLLLQAKVSTVPPASSNGIFTDVKPGSWYEQYLVAAIRMGVLEADPATMRLRPDDPVTRAEFLSMAVKTFDVNPSLFTMTYVDVAPFAWYAPVAGVGQRYRVFPKDVDPTRLRPEAKMTHTEVATAVKIFAEATAPLQPTAATRPAASWYQMISTSMQRMVMHSAAERTTVSSFLHPILILLPRPAPAASTPDELPVLRAEVLRLVNEIRAHAQVPLLSVNPSLEASAQKYADEMHVGKFFGHVSPMGETLDDRMRASGYYTPFFKKECLCVEQYLLGENLAQGQRSATEVVNNWMLSLSHRQAILNASFTDTGIGVNAGIWVMHFGGKQN